jgi:NAD-reducing hydrogenase small subunit
MERLKLATMWLGGCSGCHMSFLDVDEFLIDLAGMVDIVYTPLIDAKVFPDHVDVTLLEGAVANHDNLEFVKMVRARTKTLVSFGDCAVTGNVTAMRDPLGGAEVVLRRSYLENGDLDSQIPRSEGVLPLLLDRVTPIHAVVPVDVFIPGCPPPAPRIREVLEQLVGQHAARLTGADLKFG